MAETPSTDQILPHQGTRPFFGEDRVLPGGLPAPVTPLIGRDREAAHLAGLLRQAETRLVTLTGPGGVGKTRLALRVADEVRPEFADGVAFVALALITNPDLILPTIARAVDIADHDGRPVTRALFSALRERHSLLILDNFEHLAPAAPLLIEVLAACPRIKILVTSRAVLRVTGEFEVVLPPLSLSGSPLASLVGEAPRAVVSIHGEAVELFLQRLSVARADLFLSEQVMQAIAEICRRVDGLPLAIELAAARCRFISPEELLARLHHRLPLLTDGPRDLPARLRTMRDAIAWSHDLLDGREQQLFRRLAVFGTGFSLDALEQVAGNSGQEADARDEQARTPVQSRPMLDLLASLVEQSLVRQMMSSDHEIRFGMLQTIREYAADRLGESGEEPIVRDAHAIHFLSLMERAELALFGPEQERWVRRIEWEHDNIRAALGWTVDQGVVETALRLAGATWLFWLLRGHLGEGHGWLERALALPGGSAAARAKVLEGAGIFDSLTGRYATILPRFEQALALHRETGESFGIARALTLLGAFWYHLGDADQAITHFQEALHLYGVPTDDIGITWQSVAMIEWGAALATQSEWERALTLGERALAQQRERGNRLGMGMAHYHLAQMHRRRGDYTRAASGFRDGLSLLSGQGEGSHARFYLPSFLLGLAMVALAERQYQRAATLAAAAVALRVPLKIHFFPHSRSALDQVVTASRAALGELEFTAAREEGASLSIAQSIALALAEPTGAPPAVNDRSPDQVASSVFSRRETDVLRLIVAGHTDQEIASVLFLSRRTVTSHVTSILTKLDVPSRSAAVGVAIRRGLV